MTVDTTALTQPIDRAKVRGFDKALREKGMLRSRALTIIVFSVIGLAALVIIVPTFVSIVAMGITRSSSSGVALLPVVVIAIVIGLMVWALIRGVGGAAARRYRLSLFASANGMTWHPGFSNPRRPGMIFDLGRDQELHDVMRREHPRSLEVANYTYETGSGKSKQTHRWGYVALRLDTPLPHIVLDAVGNNGLFGGSNLPITFGRDQRLSLEGDFDKHFALYCPEGYERDALYLFTPDVMARFIDNAAALDVEIVDDWLFLYAKRDLVTLDPATWRWLFATIDAIDEKLAQWARWRDDRLAGSSAAAVPTPGTAPLLTPPPAGVAAQGRRLKRGFPVWTFVVFAAVAGWWILTTVFGR
ncbi:hypothetical protein [Microbacterium testaceum]|uniref:hypothetical protein n=1 Tax=Microbacterium testaceum TaxID=2033 RepID=UPI001CD950C6|nr:hypothetical protein [Microbacterium testaceum]